MKFLLNHGLACRGHDESETFRNRGNFPTLLTRLAGMDDEIKKVVLTNALGNCQ